MKNKLALALAALALSGCGSATLNLAQDMRAIPAQAMIPGPTPAPLTDKTFEGTVNKLVEVSGLLNMCISDKAELADWINRGR